MTAYEKIFFAAGGTPLSEKTERKGKQSCLFGLTKGGGIWYPQKQDEQMFDFVGVVRRVSGALE